MKILFNGMTSLACGLLLITSSVHGENSAEPALRFPTGFTSFHPSLTSMKMAQDIQTATDGRTVEQWNWLKEMYHEVYVANWRNHDFLYVKYNNQVQSGPAGHYYRQASWVNDAARLVGGVLDGYYGGITYGRGGWPSKSVGRYSYKVGNWTYSSSFMLNFWSRIPPPPGRSSTTYRFTWNLRCHDVDPNGVNPPDYFYTSVTTEQVFGYNTLDTVILPSNSQVGYNHWEVVSINVENITSGYSWGSISVDPTLSGLGSE